MQGMQGAASTLANDPSTTAHEMMPQIVEVCSMPGRDYSSRDVEEEGAYAGDGSYVEESVGEEGRRVLVCGEDGHEVEMVFTDAVGQDTFMTTEAPGAEEEEQSPDTGQDFSQHPAQHVDMVPQTIEVVVDPSDMVQSSEVTVIEQQESEIVETAEEGEMIHTDEMQLVAPQGTLDEKVAELPESDKAIPLSGTKLHTVNTPEGKVVMFMERFNGSLLNGL